MAPDEIAQIRKILKELMEAYDKHRVLWIEKHGTDEGFDEWFSRQTQ